MAGRVHVVETFAEAVDEDAGVRGVDVDLRVGQVTPIEGDEGRVWLFIAEDLLTE